MTLLRTAAALASAIAAALLAAAAQAQDTPPPQSSCLAMAQSVPGASFARFEPASGAPPVTPAQAGAGEDVAITYAGHSTYVIETPAGVRIATDFSGVYGRDPLPRVVTMNHAHSTHYTISPDPGIEHVLPGWGDENGPAKHLLQVDDVLIRNVPTDIRRGGMMEEGGNSIFIFEVAGLCIGHLGHLHHWLEDAHYAAIGRLDIVMVPIDGGMTQSLPRMSEIVTRLSSSIVLPMHRFSTSIEAFSALMGERFAVERHPSRSFAVSLRSLPRQATILVLEGV